MDSEIQQLQLQLLHSGYNIGQTLADGDFGPKTKAALQLFQKDHGLNPDGVFGPKTKAAVNKYCTVGPNEPPNVKHLSRFLVTSYMSAAEVDSGNNKVIPVMSDNNKLLATVDPQFFANLSLEGTGKLNDGRVLNVTGKYVTAPQIVKNVLLPVCKQMFGNKYKYGGVNADATKYLAFKVLGPQFPWGVGVKNEPLKLWISLAADLKLIPFGTKVYIKELDSMTMPDGTIHDGWCQVDDTGSAIKYNQFDFYCGTKTFMKQLHKFDVLHIWFEGSEDKFPANYKDAII